MARTINTKAATNTRLTPALTALMKQINKHPMMTPEEETAAFEKYAVASAAEKDAIAENIIKANMRFILSVAKKYSEDGDTIVDIFSVAAIGMQRAVESFDMTKGFRFITHAVNWMRAEVTNYLQKSYGIVRYKKASLIGSKDNAFAESFMQREMRMPTEEEISVGLKEEYGIDCSAADLKRPEMFFIDKPLCEDADESTAEVGEVALRMSSENGANAWAEAEHRKTQVRILMESSGLDYREKEIISMAFGLNGYDEMTYEQAADEWFKISGKRLTAERVRQIIRDALPKMKRNGQKMAQAI